jgi:putative membrane protein
MLTEIDWGGVIYFAVFFGIAIVYLFIFSAIYLWVTPYAEIKLIRSGNTAAALSFSGALLGFIIPLSKAVEQAESVLEFVVWGTLAIIVQCLSYWVMRKIFPNFVESIQKNIIAEGVLAAALSIGLGMICAASMTA